MTTSYERAFFIATYKISMILTEKHKVEGDIFRDFYFSLKTNDNGFDHTFYNFVKVVAECFDFEYDGVDFGSDDCPYNYYSEMMVIINREVKNYMDKYK